MKKPARQQTRKIGAANNQQSKAKLFFAPSPEKIIFGLFLFWAVVSVKFYRGMDASPPQKQNQPQPQQHQEPQHQEPQQQQPQQQQPQQQQEQPNTFSRRELDAALESAGIPVNPNAKVNVNANNDNINNGDHETFPDHYMTFSTACSESQNWQSFLVFYYAHKVQQPGYVIRIASGCSDQQKAELIKIHETVISKLSPNFSVHFTPNFSKISGDNYKYYNKPFGLQHWLEHGLEYEKNKDKLEDAIIMILDPDMILLRPLTYDFTDSNVLIHASKRGEPKIKKVVHGQPWACLYAFGDGPFRVDKKYVFAEHKDSPALRATRDEQINNYPGGPPYMATGRDMFAIVQTWCELVPRVHHVYEHLLGEMYGWSLAAAHLNLPHVLARFMVSAVEITDGEGWPLIDALGDDEICDYSTLREKEDKLPYVMHYCQNYWLGKWFLGKYRLDSDFLKCEKPLLLEPPDDIGKQYDFYIKPGGNPYGTKEKLHQHSIKREQFMICGMIKRLNDAATWYKEQTCEPGTANLEKSFIFHYSLDPNNNEGGEKKAKW